MAVIWKYDVPVEDEFSHEMPEGARILSVQAQRQEGGKMWVLVEPGALVVKRTFRVVGTGYDFDAAGLTYVGTFQSSDGWFVWHVFEVVA